MATTIGALALVGLASLGRRRRWAERLRAWKRRWARERLLREIALDALALGNRAAALRACDLLDGRG